MKYFDAHCHIQFAGYDEDREPLIERMTEAGVGDLASSRRAVELARRHEHLFASVGLHPNDTPEEAFDEAAFRELLLDPKVVAVGECGLDNFRPSDPEAEKKRQRDVFEAHIRLALESDKPLMIHARPSKGSQDAYRDALDILGSYKREHGERLRGDMHFFVGGVDEARGFIELGFTLSYTAVLTFTHDYDEVVRFAPLASLLTETDSPYVAPASRRGTRNDPLSIPEVAGAIADIRGEDREKVAATLLGNAQQLFKL